MCHGAGSGHGGRPSVLAELLHPHHDGGLLHQTVRLQYPVIRLWKEGVAYDLPRGGAEA